MLPILVLIILSVLFIISSSLGGEAGPGGASESRFVAGDWRPGLARVVESIDQSWWCSTSDRPQ